MERDWGSYFEGPLGRIIKGFVKLALIPVVVAMLNAVPEAGSLTVAGTTVNVNDLLNIIKAFAGLLMVLSALRDFDVKL